MGEGLFIDVDAMFSPVRDRAGRVVEIVGFGVDVTVRAEATKRLRASEATVRTVLDATPGCRVPA